MRTLIVLILTGGIAMLSACSTAPRRAAVVERDLPWLVAMAHATSLEPGRLCVESALQTSYGLVAFQRARTSDDRVREALLHGAGYESLRNQRLREADLWARTHAPADVGAEHMTWCLAQVNTRLRRMNVPLECLRAGEPAAFLSIARYTGQSETRALDAAKARYRQVANDGELETTADTVYGAPTEADDLRYRVSRFADCLARSERATF